MRGLCKQSPYESRSVSIKKKGGSDWSRLLIELNVCQWLLGCVRIHFNVLEDCSHIALLLEGQRPVFIEVELRTF